MKLWILFRRNYGKGKHKIDEVGFNSDAILDSDKLVYITSKPIKYQNGKYLIYKDQNSRFKNLLRYTPVMIPSTVIMYLLYTNPFLGIFPAAIPILFITQLIMLKLAFILINRGHNLIREINLIEGGSTTEIIFSNRLKRKLFGQPQNLIYYNSLFSTPQQIKQNQQPSLAQQFPKQIQKFKQPRFGLVWIKFYSNQHNYLLLPKYPTFIQEAILMEVFMGKVIKSK